jgi:uncharacterized Zn finger protein
LVTAGGDVQPVLIDGRTIARSFWGKGWCSHLESFSDYANRLPRGRTYARNGSVCHLEIGEGRVTAIVSGSRATPYRVAITIEPLTQPHWAAIRSRCSGQINTVLELLQGHISNAVMATVSNRHDGLFPQPGQMQLSCSCPDWATMCKHVAASLYGVGHRLDAQPELLFTLRGVDPLELITTEITLATPHDGVADDALGEDRLSDIFGIELDDDLDGPADFRAPFEASGPSVARLRAATGLSLAAFARALNVSPGSVSRWESATGPLTLRAASKQALETLYDRYA